MLSINRDLIGGFSLVAVGAAAAAFAYANYDMGQMRFIGPGLFPMATGCLLAFLGAVVVASSGTSSEETIPAEPMSLLRVMSAIAAFAVLVMPFGVVPAVSALTIIAMASRRKGALAGTLLTAAALALIGVGFKTVFGLRVAILDWPF
jgi:hypothetical protein